MFVHAEEQKNGCVEDEKVMFCFPFEPQHLKVESSSNDPRIMFADYESNIRDCFFRVASFIFL